MNLMPFVKYGGGSVMHWCIEILKEGGKKTLWSDDFTMFATRL